VEDDLLNPNNKEYFINFEQATFWRQATGMKNGVIQNEKESDIGKFSIKDAGIAKLKILITDLSEKLIIQSTQKSFLSGKWEIKDSQNNIIGKIKHQRTAMFLVDKNDNKLWKLNNDGISEPEGKILTKFFNKAESIRRGFKFITKYSYNIKIVDELVDRKLLLGTLLPMLVYYHRSGEGM